MMNGPTTYARVRPRPLGIWFLSLSLALGLSHGSHGWIPSAKAETRVTKADPRPKEPAPKGVRWCAPELQALGDICYVRGDPTKSRSGLKTLVIFLHGLAGDGTQWHLEQQRLLARMAENYGFSALIPRGELGIGPSRIPNVRAWPTTVELQERYERKMIDAWWAAKRKLERAEGGPFERVLVFGFSNGAYFAASLALRGVLDIDGYGVFAGGSGGKLARFQGANTKRRVPIFVGYGKRDPDSRGQQQLANALKVLGWRHRAKASNAGHTVTDEQIRGALRFLTPLDRTASTQP